MRQLFCPPIESAASALAPALPTVAGQAVTLAHASLSRGLLARSIDPAASSGAFGHRCPSPRSSLSWDHQAQEMPPAPGVLRSREQFDFHCQPVH